jgi:hypothetical protein
MRRSFRRGIALGLLVGTAATAVKTVLDRRAPRPAPTSGPSPERWEPLPGTTPVRIPEPAVDVVVAPGPEPESTRPAPKAKAPRQPKAPPKRTESTPAPPWVEPTSDGGCPESHPVKAKMTSGIFHVPGGLNYPRTRPDRCYIDGAAAEADGLRLSKR